MATLCGSPPSQPTPALDWTLSAPRQSCAELCTHMASTCVELAQASLTDTATVAAAFASAGVNCSLQTSCNDRNDCAQMGAPYVNQIHHPGGSDNNPGDPSECNFGSVTSSCDEVPADANHRRLCACEHTGKFPPICLSRAAGGR